MFDNERYAQASVAFRRTGRDREAKICDAYLLQEKAGLISTTASSARIQAFLAAAQAFSTCAQNSPIRRVEERLACYQAAGDCYSKARDPKRAGDSYQLAELYPEAACSYQEGGHFDQVVKVIIERKDAFADDLHERFMVAARLHYFKVYFDSWIISEHT